MHRPLNVPLAALAALAAITALAPSTTPATAQAPPDQIEIEVLSNRADLLSGGQALVELVLPASTDPALLRVAVDGVDVTDAFHATPDGRTIGRVDGLGVGANLLRADVLGVTAATIALTNHPIEGPIFSGPHLQPWQCTTLANTLGDPIDEHCNAPTRHDWFYRSTSSVTLAPYDPANPPADVATTVTDDGDTVPFIVRRERGTMNRGIYDVAVLHDPAAPWEPWAPQAGWNGKVVWNFGPSSGTIHAQGTPQSVLTTARLGEGFMVATSSLNTHGSNLNTVVSAESVMMLKEHIVENYGPIRYVIGSGGSGGAIGQQMVANTYPGLLDGLMPALNFPDTFTTGREVTDCISIVAAMNSIGGFTAAQRLAVFGHATTITCTLFPALFGSGIDPTVGCGLPQELVFHPVTNPTGVRCTAVDYMKNVWGIDPTTGFGRAPGSIIGTQYGLNALRNGVITPEQFVALNETIGTAGGVAGERRPSDPGATLIAHRTGQVNDAVHLDSVPIIDLRQNGNNEFHTNAHTWAVRERLIQSNGHADNQVIFWSSTTSLPAAATAQAFALMDSWLAAIEADVSADALEDKVLRHKPGAAVDTCWIAGVASTDYEACLQQAPYFGLPAIAAGLRPAHDIIECQTRPFDVSDYPAGTFSRAQAARLQQVFDTGVCDESAPPVDDVRTVPWLTFAGGPGGVPLPDPPTAVAVEPDDPLSQRITVHLDGGDGTLVVTVDPADRQVTMSPLALAPSGDRWTSTGELRPITVSDSRISRPGWNVAGQVGAFTSVVDDFGANHLGWSPAIPSQAAGQGATPGATVDPSDLPGAGLATSRALASAPPGAGRGTAVLGGGLDLDLPANRGELGTYSALLTLTVI